MRKRYRDNPLFKRMPTQASILEYRFLQPLRRYLDHHSLWQFNRRAIAGGLAVGLFFSVATPVAQIPFAAVFAILCRVNLPIAVLGTFFSNPFTTPALLYLAYQLGVLLVGHEQVVHAAPHQANLPVVNNGYLVATTEWMMHSFDWLMSAGLPLVTGLVVMAIILAIMGYLAVIAVWRLQARLHWRARRLRRRNC